LTRSKKKCYTPDVIDVALRDAFDVLRRRVTLDPQSEAALKEELRGLETQLTHLTSGAGDRVQRRNSADRAGKGRLSHPNETGRAANRAALPGRHSKGPEELVLSLNVIVIGRPGPVNKSLAEHVMRSNLTAGTGGVSKNSCASAATLDMSVNRETPRRTVLSLPIRHSFRLTQVGRGRD
jgi:hypothetical protein